MAKYYFGEVVNALLDDGAGELKVRPAIVVDRDADSRVDSSVIVIAITTSEQRKSRPFYHVKVHGTNTRDPVTGLVAPSWAKCNWPRQISFTDIRSRRGHLPDVLADKIAEIYDRLCEDDTFTDWQ
jgi:mRNA-degrading endonuclease toxin of MazEF toxin-antitoxin module